MTNARDLTARFASLLRREHEAMAEFILAVADFDRCRAWVELGYNGLFPFLHRELGLSKSAAFYRKTAAELVQRFPEIVEPLREGKLCLSSVAELAEGADSGEPGRGAAALPPRLQAGGEGDPGGAGSGSGAGAAGDRDGGFRTSSGHAGRRRDVFVRGCGSVGRTPPFERFAGEPRACQLCG